MGERSREGEGGGEREETEHGRGRASESREDGGGREEGGPRLREIGEGGTARDWEKGPDGFGERRRREDGGVLWSQKVSEFRVVSWKSKREGERERKGGRRERGPELRLRESGEGGEGLGEGTDSERGGGVSE